LLATTAAMNLRAIYDIGEFYFGKNRHDVAFNSDVALAGFPINKQGLSYSPHTTAPATIMVPGASFVGYSRMLATPMNTSSGIVVAPEVLGYISLKLESPRF
jgi:hypothetical protein